MRLEKPRKGVSEKRDKILNQHEFRYMELIKYYHKGNKAIQLTKEGMKRH